MLLLNVTIIVVLLINHGYPVVNKIEKKKRRYLISTFCCWNIATIVVSRPRGRKLRPIRLALITPMETQTYTRKPTSFQVYASVYKHTRIHTFPDTHSRAHTHLAFPVIFVLPAEDQATATRCPNQ